MASKPLNTLPQTRSLSHWPLSTLAATCWRCCVTMAQLEGSARLESIQPANCADQSPIQRALHAIDSAFSCQRAKWRTANANQPGRHHHHHHHHYYYYYYIKHHRSNDESLRRGLGLLGWAEGSSCARDSTGSVGPDWRAAGRRFRQTGG